MRSDSCELTVRSSADHCVKASARAVITGGCHCPLNDLLGWNSAGLAFSVP